jgi:hypothetical protein
LDFETLKIEYDCQQARHDIRDKYDQRYHPQYTVAGINGLP